MARRTFFSFHFERDAWRAAQVRNCWVTKDREDAGFWDAAKWEEVKKKGDEAIKAWIRDQLNGTSVTVVLIGSETANRKYVQYEIQQSVAKGNGIVGIFIHNLKDSRGVTDLKGVNPLSVLHLQRDGRAVLLSDIYKSYDWVLDQGGENIAAWIEAAATAAGR